MRLLFLSHCATDAPDKGEKVRAYHSVTRLSLSHELHVAAFARRQQEVDALTASPGRCASVHVELLSPASMLARAAVPFALGGCLNLLFYKSARLARHVSELHAVKPFDAAIAYSLPMAQYVPGGVPFVLDMQDVDSEKWFQYGSCRFPGWLYKLEAGRLRTKEVEYARLARKTFFVTRAEEQLFRDFAGDLPTGYIENGWGAEAANAPGPAGLPELAGRRYLAFVGSMDYYPNAEGAIWFAREIFPELRRRDASLEFFIIGRSPGRTVTALGGQPGVTVTGTVPDPRPYIKDCLAAVAPLQLARGIQLKVIEGLAMGKPVLVSPAVAKTLSGVIPPGVTVCTTAEDYWRALTSPPGESAETIRETVRSRFDGYRNLSRLEEEVTAIGEACRQ